MKEVFQTLFILSLATFFGCARSQCSDCKGGGPRGYDEDCNASTDPINYFSADLIINNGQSFVEEGHRYDVQGAVAFHEITNARDKSLVTVSFEDPSTRRGYFFELRKAGLVEEFLRAQASRRNLCRTFALSQRSSSIIANAEEGVFGSIEKGTEIFLTNRDFQIWVSFYYDFKNDVVKLEMGTSDPRASYAAIYPPPFYMSLAFDSVTMRAHIATQSKVTVLSHGDGEYTCLALGGC